MIPFSDSIAAIALNARRVGLSHSQSAARAGISRQVLTAWVTAGAQVQSHREWQSAYVAAECAYESALRCYALNHAKDDGHVAVKLLSLHLAEARERARDKTRRAIERADLAIKKASLNKGSDIDGSSIADARIALASALASLASGDSEE